MVWKTEAFVFDVMLPDIEEVTKIEHSEELKVQLAVKGGGRLTDDLLTGEFTLPVKKSDPGSGKREVTA